MNASLMVMISLLMPISLLGNCVIRASHCELLRKGFDLTDQKKSWSSDRWYVEWVFLDSNEDGPCQVMTSSVSEKDRMGDVWRHWRVSKDGTLRRLSEDAAVVFTCNSSSFFRMRCKQAGNVLIGLGMDAGSVASDRIHIEEKTPDCRFGMKDDCKQTMECIKPAFDVYFETHEVDLVERLYPEWYFGFDFRPPPPDPHGPHTTWFGYQQPKGDLRLGGGVVKPDCFDALAAEYRKGVKAKRGIVGKVDVYAVFLDVDNDGHVDCYVSSSAEELDGGKCPWTLYVNRDGALAKADAPVYPVPSKKELCVLPPVVTARKSGFCRVVRFDVNPIFIVLDGTGSPTKVRDAITNVMAHRIEKLECVCFPDEEVPKKQ